jgi:hypothetical protein
MVGKVERASIASAILFALLLPAMLLRAESIPTTIDSLICAASVAEWRPGFLDGKPTFAFVGQAVRGLNYLQGGDRADLIQLLSGWSALLGWGTLVNVFLIARHLYRGSHLRAWAAVGLLGTAPVFAFMSAITEKHTVNLFFLTLAILMWLRRRYLAWGMFWGIAVGAHLTSVLLVIPFLLSLRWDPARREDVRPALGGALAAMLVSVPLYLWVLFHSRGLGVYLASVRQTVLHDYNFLGALRPDRIARFLIAQPLSLVLILILAAGTAATVVSMKRRSRKRREADSQGRSPDPERRREKILAAVVALAAGGLVALVHGGNLPNILMLAGIPLLVAAAARALQAMLGGRLRTSAPNHFAGRAVPEMSTFLIPWLAVAATFFVMWDHFYGQFSIYIVLPLSLLVAGLGAMGRASEREAIIPGMPGWSAALLGLAILSGAWRSWGIVDRLAWTPLQENDAVARSAAAVVTPGALIVTSWDGANFRYHFPDLDITMLTPDERKETVQVWKKDRPSRDPREMVREARAEGRDVFVSHRVLTQDGVDEMRSAREEILMGHHLRETSPGLFKLVPDAC